MSYYIFMVIFIVVILYLIAIMPKVLNKPNLSLFEGRYYAHRGLHQDTSIAPENSLAAFRLSIESDFGIELDVQLSKDGIPVVFHDFNLERVCGIDKNINELTFHELRQLSLFNSDEKIPHLQEVIDLVNGQVPLIIEIKARHIDCSVCSVIATILDNYKGVYCIESFNPLIVLWYKKNRPQIIRGQISTNYFKSDIKQNKILGFVLQNLLSNFITKPNFISYNYEYRRCLSFVLCRKLYNIPTIAYTVPSKLELDNCLISFDLFIFEGFLPN